MRELEFGSYQQWISENDYIYMVGIKDAVFINDDITHKHAYFDWEKHKNDFFYFGVQPIKWLVMEESDNYLFVVSKYNIECRQFHTMDTRVTWEESSIREWLNKDFFENAFNMEEREAIVLSEIENEWNPFTLVAGGKTTKDKVFLLSLRDVFNIKYGFECYATASETRVAKNTQWTKVMGALTNPERGMGWYWLRTSGESTEYAARIDYSGMIFVKGLRTTLFGGVRPAMFLDKGKMQCNK